MKTKSVLVKCWTPEWYDSVTHAVIEFDEALVDDLLEKLHYAQLVADRYGSEKRFMGLEFDSYDPNFINLGDPANLGIDDDELDEGYVILAAENENHEALDNETGMRPVMQMVMAGDVVHPRLKERIMNGRVFWYGFDKHGGAGCRAETYSLYEKDIREIKEALQ